MELYAMMVEALQEFTWMGSMWEISLGNSTSLPYQIQLSLSFWNTGLRGSIPQQIFTLSKLTFQSLSSNNLTGHFPLFLTNLTQLESFFIYQNLICGPIPKELGNFKNLQILDLRYNKLTRSIPSTMGLLTNLQYLDLSLGKMPIHPLNFQLLAKRPP